MTESLLVEYDSVCMQHQSLLLLQNPQAQIDTSFYILPQMKGLENNMVAQKYSNQPNAYQAHDNK